MSVALIGRVSPTVVQKLVERKVNITITDNFVMDFVGTLTKKGTTDLDKIIIIPNAYDSGKEMEEQLLEVQKVIELFCPEAELNLIFSDQESYDKFKGYEFTLIKYASVNFASDIKLSLIIEINSAEKNLIKKDEELDLTLDIEDDLDEIAVSKEPSLKEIRPIEVLNRSEVRVISFCSISGDSLFVSQNLAYILSKKSVDISVVEGITSTSNMKRYFNISEEWDSISDRLNEGRPIDKSNVFSEPNLTWVPLSGKVRREDNPGLMIKLLNSSLVSRTVFVDLGGSWNTNSGLAALDYSDLIVVVVDSKLGGDIKDRVEQFKSKLGDNLLNKVKFVGLGFDGYRTIKIGEFIPEDFWFSKIPPLSTPLVDKSNWNNIIVSKIPEGKQEVYKAFEDLVNSFTGVGG